MTNENAKMLCNWIIEGFRKGLIVEWRKSRTWGMNHHISLGDERECVRVSGCGYCKESTALAHCLCWLFEPKTEAYNDVSRTAGAGVSSVAEALAKHGWKLEAVAEGKNSRIYWLGMSETRLHARERSAGLISAEPNDF